MLLQNKMQKICHRDTEFTELFLIKNLCGLCVSVANFFQNMETGDT